MVAHRQVEAKTSLQSMAIHALLSLFCGFKMLLEYKQISKNVNKGEERNLRKNNRGQMCKRCHVYTAEKKQKKQVDMNNMTSSLPRRGQTTHKTKGHHSHKGSGEKHYPMWAKSAKRKKITYRYITKNMSL